jgi:6-phosphogluconolactonase
LSRSNTHISEGPQELARAAAETFVEEAANSIREKGSFAVALAGGSTPKALYELLATEYRDTLDWKNVHAFFGDERTVPPDHEDSNYRMAYEALLSRVPVGSVHRMRGELHPQEAAILYEKELETFFGGAPRFDLILLGIGEDGHTASLFPGTAALDVTDRFVVENPVEKLDTVRLTLTLPAINAAKGIIFLVAGEGKAGALKEILEGNANTHEYPAKFVRPEGGATWMVDRAAAVRLNCQYWP